MNRTFQKLLILLFIIVIFDTFYLWDVFDSLEDQTSGPEAGLHNFQNHESRRIESLYQKVISGIHMGDIGRSILNMGEPISLNHGPDFDKLSSTEKIARLQKEVNDWKSKYEVAMARLGENPYPEQFGKAVAVPYTPVPPNTGTDDRIRKPKKTLAELEKQPTYGADERILKILHSARVEVDEELAQDLPTWDDVVSLYGD